ncbi:MAG: hypothetical protein IKT40_06375 [Bacilli bacterium]|nr:hypothetical protein [Bacilli bacterium]
MKNKILVKVYVISISEEYEIYIPVNESIKAVIGLIVKSVAELSDNFLPANDNYCLLNCDNNALYNYSLIVRDTDITNGKKLFLV